MKYLKLFSQQLLILVITFACCYAFCLHQLSKTEDSLYSYKHKYITTLVKLDSTRILLSGARKKIHTLSLVNDNLTNKIDSLNEVNIKLTHNNSVLSKNITNISKTMMQLIIDRSEVTPLAWQKILAIISDNLSKTEVERMVIKDRLPVKDIINIVDNYYSRNSNHISEKEYSLLRRYFIYSYCQETTTIAALISKYDRGTLYYGYRQTILKLEIVKPFTKVFHEIDLLIKEKLNNV